MTDGRPDVLHQALGAVLTDREWRAFCDAWLAIGLAATMIKAMVKLTGTSELKMRESAAKAIGRVRYKPLPKDRGA